LPSFSYHFRALVGLRFKMLDVIDNIVWHVLGLLWP
jgi:hypothetical protein